MHPLFLRFGIQIIAILFLIPILGGNIRAQELDYKPKILLVTAHPDDDALFSATVFKTTKLLGGTVDLALMTNGEGGYTYSTLGNFIYGMQLDNEEVGREKLPSIRKKELMAGGDIVGIRNYYFFDQQDFYFTLDVNETLEKWDTEWVLNRLTEIITKEEYDFLFLMMPFDDTHGHHKAATIIAHRAISRVELTSKPILLQAYVRTSGEESTLDFIELEGFPETKISTDIPPFEFDRNQTFGVNNRLNYNIIANWVIAEHKSQGTMQLFMRSNVVEQYYFLDRNDRSRLPKAKAFFEAVNSASPK